MQGQIRYLSVLGEGFGTILSAMHAHKLAIIAWPWTIFKGNSVSLLQLHAPAHAVSPVATVLYYM